MEELETLQQIVEKQAKLEMTAADFAAFGTVERYINDLTMFQLLELISNAIETDEKARFGLAHPDIGPD